MPDKVSYQEAISLQPKALDSARATTNAVLDAADLSALRHGVVGIVGIGASLYAGVAGAAQFRQQGRRAVAFAGGELYDGAVDAADAYIAVSASGRSVEPARAMQLRPQAPTYGIAKAADTPLAGVVRTMIGTGSGVDSSPNTTSYVGSLLALGLIAERVGNPTGYDWARLPGTVDEMLSKSRPAVTRATELLAGKAALDVVGAGVANGTAGYVALLAREAARIVAQSWDTLNFLHGPMEPNDARSGVIVFGSGREVQLAEDLANFGIPTVLFTPRAVAERKNLVVIETPVLGNGLAEAIVEAVPGQLLVGALAEAAGLPQCIFRYRQTDTKLDVAPSV
ncbi:MAG TPA: phosphosugar isomerase [Devosiaceae bacterium]|nr:phosphosugar isomerase [Devosiaceae bacterium]